MIKPLILHCYDGLGIGGAETQLILLLRHIPSQMFDHVVCHLGPSGEQAHEIRALGIPVFDLSAGRRYSSLALLRLMRMTRRLRPALIHADHDYGKLYARITSRALHIPLLTTKSLTASTLRHLPGGGYHLPRFNRLLTWVERTGARISPEHTLAISQTVMHDLIRQGVPAARTSVVYRGLNLGDFHRLPAEQLEALRRTLGLAEAGPLLVNVGRLISRKRQDLVIRAMPAVRRGHPRAKLLLVGDGPERERYRELAAAEGVGDSVLLLGTRRDVLQILQLADAFVFPSMQEGTGVALLEAMAMSRACVVSDLPVFREVLGEDGAGLFVPAERPDLLAEALLIVLGDPVRAAAMGQRAREVVKERFDIRRNALDFARLCHRIIATRQPGAWAEVAS